MSRPSFASRVAAGRRLVAAGRAGAFPLPGHAADQMDAATSDALRIVRRNAAVLPGRYSEVDANAVDADWLAEMKARTLAALADCRPCSHLRGGGPQPGAAHLAFHSIDCGLCNRTVRKPPTGEDDRCDWCGARGINRFTPVVTQAGPVIVAGDACDDCIPHIVLPKLRDAS